MKKYQCIYQPRVDGPYVFDSNLYDSIDELKNQHSCLEGEGKVLIVILEVVDILD